MSNKLQIFALIALTLFFATRAFAQDQSTNSQPCTLKRLASLDMTVTPTGSISVPVGIAGNTYNFIVELSGFSSLTAAVADKLNLTHEKSLDQFRGLPATYVADVPDFQIGAIHSSNIQMSVVDHYLLPGSEGANGIIGADLLQKFGVELISRLGSSISMNRAPVG